MKHLYYTRHGLTEMNEQGLFAGRIETPLTKKGRLQAKKAGGEAKKLGIDCIVSSPMSRAHDTAKIIAKEIGYPADKIHLNALFIERHFGELEGHTYSPDLDIDGFADIETRDELIERARLALSFLASLPANNILVVSHGSFGRALRHHVLEDFPFDNVNKLANAKIHHWL